MLSCVINFLLKKRTCQIVNYDMKAVCVCDYATSVAMCSVLFCDDKGVCCMIKQKEKPGVFDWLTPTKKAGASLADTPALNTCFRC